MDTVQKYRRAFAAGWRGYKKGREEARKRPEGAERYAEKYKLSAGEILRDAGGAVGFAVGWTAWSIVCIGLLTAVLLAFGVPLWVSLGVGIVCFAFAVEVAPIRES